ncbi:MAG: aspartyl protease family protein [Sphingomonas sp.]
MISRRNLVGALGAGALLPGALRAAPAPLSVPIRLTQSRVLVTVRFGDAGAAHWFAIDTGAVVNLIQTSLAKELRLPKLGTRTMTGAGGSETMTIHVAERVVIGDAIGQRGLVFAEFPGRGLGEGVRGALAAGLLTTLDTDLDFGAGEWRVYPEGRASRSGFARLESEIRHVNGPAASAYIFADIELEGRTYRMLLDTGMPRPLTLFSPATRKSGLWDDPRPWAPGRRGGVGGAGAMGRTVRLKSAKFGGVALDPPTAFLLDPGAGISELRVDGMIGLPILRRFNLSTQVKPGVLWAQPNGMAPGPDLYGLSGLWIGRAGKDLTAERVGRGSPAEAAGLREGDRILGIGFDQLLDKISGPPGSEVVVQASRAGRSFEARIVLRDYL